MQQNYSGFVYIWMDKTNGMFYIGSHFGMDTDRYKGSGIRFMRAFKIRPDQFKRRIVEYVDGDRQYLMAREQAWLNLIKDEELNVRYYNQKKVASGGSVRGRKQPMSEETRLKLMKPKKNTQNYKRPKSEDHKANIKASLIGRPGYCGEENPRFCGVTNEMFREEWVSLSRKLGMQPTFEFFRRVFFAKHGLEFPKSLSKFRFNHGKELFSYVESELGFCRAVGKISLDPIQFT